MAAAMAAALPRPSAGGSGSLSRAAAAAMASKYAAAEPKPAQLPCLAHSHCSSRGSGVAQRCRRNTARSEEHTSELQSLMRISYAVFCLKKKKQIIKTTIQTHQIY